MQIIFQTKQMCLSIDFNSHMGGTGTAASRVVDEIICSCDSNLITGPRKGAIVIPFSDVKL